MYRVSFDRFFHLEFDSFQSRRKNAEKENDLIRVFNMICSSYIQVDYKEIIDPPKAWTVQVGPQRVILDGRIRTISGEDDGK